jgi:hypothetical protein
VGILFDGSIVDGGTTTFTGSSIDKDGIIAFTGGNALYATGLLATDGTLFQMTANPIAVTFD